MELTIEPVTLGAAASLDNKVRQAGVIQPQWPKYPLMLM